MSRPAEVPVEDLMATVMARQVRSDDWVSHGASVPLAGAALFMAMELHAPDVDFWMHGCVNPSHRNLSDAILRPELMYSSAEAHMSQTDIINFELRGKGTFQFLRPVQIDPFGNVNASRIGPRQAPKQRFFSIAVGDAINAVVRTCLYVTEHSPRVFREELEFRTGTGHHQGREWRSEAGLHAAGPVCVVTPLAVLDFGEDLRLRLRTLHAGVTVEQVREATGFELPLAPDLAETPAPSSEELEALNRVDPERIRLLEFRGKRREIMDRFARTCTMQTDDQPIDRLNETGGVR